MIITTTIYPDGRQEMKTECTEKEIELFQTQKVDVDYQTYDLRRKSRNISLN